MIDGRTHYEGCHEKHLDCALYRLAASEAKCAVLTYELEIERDYGVTKRVQAAALAAEIATLRAAVEERERAIVWMAEYFAFRAPESLRYDTGPESGVSVGYDGTDADLIRVVLEQSKGGE